MTTTRKSQPDQQPEKPAHQPPLWPAGRWWWDHPLPSAENPFPGGWWDERGKELRATALRDWLKAPPLLWLVDVLANGDNDCLRSYCAARIAARRSADRLRELGLDADAKGPRPKVPVFELLRLTKPDPVEPGAIDRAMGRMVATAEAVRALLVQDPPKERTAAAVRSDQVMRLVEDSGLLPRLLRASHLDLLPGFMFRRDDQAERDRRAEELAEASVPAPKRKGAA